MDFFVINFQIWTSYQKFNVFVLFINKTKNLSEAVGNNSSQIWVRWHTQHGVSFTTSCLPISEYGSIVTLDNRLDQWKCTFIINNLLLGICIVNCIIRKISRHCPGFIWSQYRDLIHLFIYLENWFASSFDLWFVHWTYSNHNLDGFSRIFRHSSSVI